MMLFRFAASAGGGSDTTAGMVVPEAGRFGLTPLLICAMLCGFVIAAGSHATWQVPVESGQVLAGLVSYPAGNPMAVYHFKLWSMLNQGSALLLHSGISEIAVSILIAGMLGAVSFAGVSLVVFSLCGNSLLALMTPLLMQHAGLVGEGMGYPIWLMGTPHSYGIMGLSWSLLVIGLFGTGRYRSGALLAGIAPALHPSLGAFTLLVIGATLFLQWREFRPHWRPTLSWFCCGALLCAASLGWQLYISAGLPQLDAVTKREYLQNFIANHDHHRHAGKLISGGSCIAMMSLVLCSAIMCDRDKPFGTRIVVTALFSSLFLTLLIVVSGSIVPALGFLQVLIPWRFLNLANLAFVPLLVGILGAKWSDNPVLGRAVLLVFICGGVIWGFSPLFQRGLLYVLAGLASIALVVIRIPMQMPERLSKVCNMSIAAIGILLALLLISPAAGRIITGEYRSPARFADRTSDSFFKGVSLRPGLLLTAGSMHLSQLRTRRPVLVDGGALDFFSYVPETGPELNRILRKVYGLDIFIAPPPGHNNRGKITDLHRPLWEARSPDEWRKIKEEFDVTDILTPVGWNLQLPLLLTNGRLNFYTIPQHGGTP